MAFSGEIIKLSAIRDAAKKELFAYLDSVQSGGVKEKVLVIDPDLVQPLCYTEVTDFEELKGRGVTNFYPLTDNPIDTKVKNIVFVVRPELQGLKLLAENIRYIVEKSRKSQDIHVCFLPRKTLMCHHILKEEYMINPATCNVTLSELDIDLFPLEEDVLSLELPFALSQNLVDGDSTSLHLIAKALVKLQSCYFGPVPTIRAKGRLASRVANILKSMSHEVGTEFMSGVNPEVDSLYIFDRELDMVTPMMTQLTYEGLIEEFYGIRTCQFTPPFEIQTDGKQESVATLSLNSKDKVFSELRDLNFTRVHAQLKQKALYIKSVYDQRKNLSHLRDIKDFMRALPELQEEHRMLGVHTAITQQMGKTTSRTDFRKGIEVEQNILTGDDERSVLAYVEDAINRGEHFTKVLRYLCMLSLTTNGIKTKVYESLRESCAHVYGVPQTISAFHKLEKAGMLKRQGDGKAMFPVLRRACKLWVDDLNEANPNDLAYVYSGYAPLSARIVEMATDNPDAWDSDLMRHIPGEQVEIKQDVEVPGNTRVVVVVFIGGVTAAEISALRFLKNKERDREGTTHFIVLTTGICGGKQMLQSFLPFETE